MPDRSESLSAAHSLQRLVTLPDFDDGRGCGKFGTRAVLFSTGTDGISATL